MLCHTLKHAGTVRQYILYDSSKLTRFLYIYMKQVWRGRLLVCIKIDVREVELRRQKKCGGYYYPRSACLPRRDYARRDWTVGRLPNHQNIG